MINQNQDNTQNRYNGQNIISAQEYTESSAGILGVGETEEASLRNGLTGIQIALD